jgi:hypothetical protein
MFRHKKQTNRIHDMSQSTTAHPQVLSGHPGNLDPGQSHKVLKLRDQVREKLVQEWFLTVHS